MPTRRQASAGKKRYPLRRKLYTYRNLMKSSFADASHSAPAPTAQSTQDASELTQLRETIVRQRAEFDNFRKRAQREKDMIREAAAEGVLAKLLPVVDNLDRAISSADTAADVKSVRDGISMIANQLHRVLEAEGLKKIDALHQLFNPTLHDALATEERSDIPANHISEVLMPGYLYKEKLLRAAMVKVAKSPSQ